MLGRIALIAIIAISAYPFTVHSQIPMENPECATWDLPHNRYLISLNVDGDIIQIDTSGTLTMFKHLGQTINSACIGGNTFYQTGMQTVYGFDLETAGQVFYVALPAVYLGGCAADTGGYLYVVDIPTWTGGAEDRIWKVDLSNGAYTKFASTDRGLGYLPRDVIFDAEHNRLLVIGAREPVYIQAISIEDSSVTNLVRFETDYSNGLARDQFGNTYATGYDNGIIYRYDSNFTSPPEIVSVGYDAPCNIDYNSRDHVLAIPNYWGDRLEFLRVGRPELTRRTFSDLSGGDADSVFESGESIELVVTVTNPHFLPLTDVSVDLIAATGGLTITQGSADIGSIPARSEITNSGSPFLFDIPPETENQMVSFDLEMTYTSDYGTEIDTVIIEAPIGGVSILLLDDDHDNWDVDQYYREALALVDSTYHIWHTTDGLPETAYLRSFDVVIWFTGNHRPALLDTDEITAMKDYMDVGGNLILTGQGIASHLDTVDQDFLSDYLRSELLGTDFWYNMAADTGGQVFNPSDTIKIGGSGGANNQTVFDHVGPVNGGVAELKYYGQPGWSAVSYSGTYRLLFLTFGFEAVINDNPFWTDRDLIFPEIVGFFDWINPFFCCTDTTGNVDGDEEGIVDIGDLTALIGYLFIPPNEEPACLMEANVDGDEAGVVDIGDLTALISYLFIPPNPPPAGCMN